MKLLCIFSLTILIAACCTAAISQTRNTSTRAAKVAVIDSNAFKNRQTGIIRLVDAFQVIDAEFKLWHEETRALETRYDNLIKIPHRRPEPGDIPYTEKLAEIKQLAEIIKRRKEDHQQRLDRRTRQLMEPIYIDINKALQTFAEQHGIDVILDVAKLGDSVMVISNAVDITRSFIAHYNKNYSAETPAKN